MRNHGEILLISCYELGHQPLGLGSPLGFLEHSGFRPAALDISVEPLPEDAVSRAALAGLSVPMHTALRLGVRVARRIRALNPACHICFYGHYAWLNSAYLLEALADSVVGGEYEATLVELAEALDLGRSLEAVRGLGRRSRPAPPSLEKIRFVLPSREQLRPLAEYAALEAGGQRRPAGYVEASRGCRHLCRHCPIPPVYQGRFFVVPRDLVLSDIAQQVRADATHITFGDPDFLNGPGHALAVVRAMHREHPRITFDFTAKVEHLLMHGDLLPELASLGCLFVVSAVESLSDRVLGILEKGHTRRDVTRALMAVREAGITLRPSLVPFTPWSSLDDYGELLDFVESEDLIEAVDPVQFSVRLLVPPGSRLLEHPEARPCFGPLDQESFTHPWVHPDPRMDSLHREVSAVVERAAHEAEEPLRTFDRIRGLFLTAQGPGRAARRLTAFDLPRRRPPRLTESWFC